MINYFRYITFYKIYNYFLLAISYLLSTLLHKNIRWGEYAALSIEPTNSCNLSCPECPTGMASLQRGKGKFPFDAFEKLIAEKKSSLIYLNFYFQGEPFLNKDLLQMVNVAHRNKIYTSTSTNAQLINKEIAKEIVLSGLDRILISIDGTTQEVFERYRVGGDLAKVLSATKEIVYWKKKLKRNNPQLVFQFLVFRFNEHQISEIKAMAKAMNVDKLSFKTAQLYHLENADDIVPTINKYARYKKDKDARWKIKSNFPNRCWRMWHSAVITQDLNLVPCCFDKDAEHIFGNIKQNTLSEIEQNTLYKNFRTQITENRAAIEICRNCSEGLDL